MMVRSAEFSEIILEIRSLILVVLTLMLVRIRVRSRQCELQRRVVKRLL
jgi:hypothetical protein